MDRETEVIDRCMVALMRVEELERRVEYLEEAAYPRSEKPDVTAAVLDAKKILGRERGEK